MKKEEMKRIEIIIGYILRIGVFLSALVIILGMLMILISGKTGYSYNSYPFSFNAIYNGVVSLKPLAIIMFGLFLLILTPVLRVIVSIYAFAKENDQLYVWITSFTLFILLIGMTIGYLGK